MHTRKEKLEAFDRLLDVIETLRVKCPWDKKQTNESLRPNTIEEVYELCDALMKNDDKDTCKELGDVLMHVLFYAKFGEEKESFDLYDVCKQLTDKLIYRHPHIYGTAVAETSEKVCENWEQLKLKEKDGNKSVLSGVPVSLPSLIKAYRIQDKARNVGFDWEDRIDVWKKVHEEVDELKAELETYAAERANDKESDSAKAAKERTLGELGDFIFSIVNASRLYHLNPDTALEKTNQKFIRRFNYIEEHSIKIGKPLKDMTLSEMDELWNEAKKTEKSDEFPS
jgi:MazG family protein